MKNEKDKILMIQLPENLNKLKILITSLRNCWSQENWLFYYYLNPALKNMVGEVVKELELFSLGNNKSSDLEIMPFDFNSLKGLLPSENKLVAILEEDWLPARDMLLYFEIADKLLELEKVNVATAICRPIPADDDSISAYRMGWSPYSYPSGAWSLSSNTEIKDAESFYETSIVVAPDVSRVKKMGSDLLTSDKIFKDKRPLEQAWSYENNEPDGDCITTLLEFVN